MSMIAALAANGAQCLDADTVLTPAIAAALAQMGYQGAIRYVSRTVPNNPGDISAAEAQTIIGVGMALMLVQHCPVPYWTPTADLGTQYGTVAGENAVAVGYPADATIWLDLENMRPGCGSAAIDAYVNAWSRAVMAGGFTPGVYFSADCPETPDQIYLDWITTQYWRSLSADTPAVAVRGACIQQFLQSGQVAGIDIDRDVITADMLGGLPSWAIAAP